MGGAFGGFLFVVIGTWLLLEQTALVQVSFWDMWPALLVVFGCSSSGRARRHRGGGRLTTRTT